MEGDAATELAYLENLLRMARDKIFDEDIDAALEEKVY